MQYRHYLVTRVTTKTTLEKVVVYADSESQAQARATVGPWKNVQSKDGVMLASSTSHYKVSKPTVRVLDEHEIEVILSEPKQQY